jgi:hypothetical protein
MSLSTQLTRGTLALPMLALFAVLALVSGEAVSARALAPEAGPAVQAQAGTGETTACGAQLRPQLLLAQAPADLGPLAQRQGAGCRA